MQVRPIKTRIFKEGDDLVAFIKKHIPKLKNGSILAVTSKIVALAERRVVKLDGNPDAPWGSGSRLKRRENQKVKVIRDESDWALRTKYVWLTMKEGMFLANAGVDESNATGKLILLPKDSFKAASELRRKLTQLYKVKLGILITDSRVMPLRAGVVGIALGYAGFKGLRDYRGMRDIFGRKLKFTQTDVADALATAATLAMGEGRERQPLCVIENAPVVFTKRVNRRELLIPIEDDMYGPLFRKISRKKRR